MSHQVSLQRRFHVGLIVGFSYHREVRNSYESTAWSWSRASGAEHRVIARRLLPSRDGRAPLTLPKLRKTHAPTQARCRQAGRWSASPPRRSRNRSYEKVD